MLYDIGDSWIGINIIDQFNELTSVTLDDQYGEKTIIETDEHTIQLLFSSRPNDIARRCVQDFNVDVIGDKVLGIEIIVKEENNIEKREIPTCMIKSIS